MRPPSLSMPLPLATRTSVELLPFGTRVAYHHRAAVARYIMAYKPAPSNLGVLKDTLFDKEDENRLGWVLTEGRLKWDSHPHETFVHPPNKYRHMFKEPVRINQSRYNSMSHAFFDDPQAKDDYGREHNKTVMVWPEDGFGWIIGIIRKSIGRSYSSSGRYEDYEQGWHHTHMYVDLYVVKLMYEGLDYIYCPLFACNPIHDND